MISDERQKLLAKNLVEYSISVQKGEKVWIDAFGIDVSFVNALVDAVYAAGAKFQAFLQAVPCSTRGSNSADTVRRNRPL